MMLNSQRSFILSIIGYYLMCATFYMVEANQQLANANFDFSFWNGPSAWVYAYFALPIVSFCFFLIQNKNPTKYGAVLKELHWIAAGITLAYLFLRNSLTNNQLN